MLTDMHCHLQDDAIKTKLPEIITRAQAKGIDHFLCCGTTESDWTEILQLHKNNSSILAALGIHPWKVDTISDHWLDNLKRLLKANRATIIGEIGLDLHFKKAAIERQTDVFIQQMALAQQLSRPVVIHNLKGWHLLLPLLKKFPDINIMLHSFYTSAQITQELVAMPNIYFSFGGAILSKNDKKLSKILQLIPDNRLLTETDAPFMLPAILHHQKYNEPANMIFTIEKLAKIKNITVKKLKSQLDQNSQQFLGVKGVIKSQSS